MGLRALFVTTHPVQYAAPQYRRLSTDPRIDVTVAFLAMHGVESSPDPDFQVEVKWDVPLLDGYRWVLPPNRSFRSSSRGFFGYFNPKL